MSTRLPDYDYRFGAFFFTLVTENRLPIFGRIINKEIQLSREGMIVKEEWLRTPIIRQEVELDEWIIMPDHFHAIVFMDGFKTMGDGGHVGGDCCRPCPSNDGTIPDNKYRIQSIQPLNRSLARIISQFKATTTRRINEIHQTPKKPVWQRGYDERIIRNEVQLDKLREYIRTNPERE